MPKMETQTSRSAIKSPVKSLDEQPRVHTPVPAEFHHHHHHRHHNPPASQEDTLTTLHAHAHPLAHRHLHGQPAKSTTLDLEVEMKIKTQEIQGIREEVNQLEAKLLHDAEVLQIKEHELGVLEGKLIVEEEKEAALREDEVEEVDKENRAPRAHSIPSVIS